jgi:NADH-ubiquinone oxidoreductase chain 5
MVIHALFKALLFICAGELISLHAHGQELRWIGNLVSQAPVARSCILLANLALCGAPFIAGFYSKDLILELILSNQHNPRIVLITLCTVGFTSFYSVRFRLVTIWGPRTHRPLRSVKEDNNVVIPILIISATSICGGAAVLWLLPYTTLTTILPLSLKLAPLLAVLVGFVTAWALRTNAIPTKRLLLTIPLIHTASCLIWFLVPLASQFQLKTPLNLGHEWFKTVDHSWLELLSGQGIFKSITNSRNTIMALGPKSATSYIISGLILSTLIIIVLTCKSSLN